MTFVVWSYHTVPRSILPTMSWPLQPWEPETWWSFCATLGLYMYMHIHVLECCIPAAEGSIGQGVELSPCSLCGQAYCSLSGNLCSAKQVHLYTTQYCTVFTSKCVIAHNYGPFHPGMYSRIIWIVIQVHVASSNLIVNCTCTCSLRNVLLCFEVDCVRVVTSKH